jgi:hypothetical protein
MSNVNFTLRHSYQSCPTWISHYGTDISHVQREAHTTAQISVMSNVKFTLRHRYQSCPTWTSHYGTDISHVKPEVHTTAQMSVMSNLKFWLRHRYQSCQTWSSHYGTAISLSFFAEFFPFWYILLSTDKRLPSSKTNCISLILQRTSCCVYEQNKSL